MIIYTVAEQVHPGDQCIYSSEGNFDRAFKTAQDGSTTHLYLPKYSQPQHTNCLQAKYRNLLLKKRMEFNCDVCLQLHTSRNITCFIPMTMTV